MTDPFSEQLDKILALADSDQEGEAVVAARKARKILSRDGLSFGDLVRAAFSRGFVKSSGGGSFQRSYKDHLESRIRYLAKEVEELRGQLQTQDLQLGFWRRRAIDLEKKTKQVSNEAGRWKKLASDTADHLWDVGCTIGGEELGVDEFLIETEPLAARKN